jgi:uncharacterized protein YaiI (UPF0178 family)
MTTIYVDADACPVIGQVEKTAEHFHIPVILLCDTNHVLHSEYSQVIVVDTGADSVDFALINRCSKNDIVVTQDYGVACMALSKNAFPIHQSGKWYTNENIDELMMARHLSKKVRRGNGKSHMKGPSKRTDEDNKRFEESFMNLIKKVTNINIL